MDIKSSVSGTVGTNMSTITVSAAERFSWGVGVNLSVKNSTALASGAEMQATVTFPSGLVPKIFVDTVTRHNGATPFHCRLTPSNTTTCSLVVRNISSTSLAASSTLQISLYWLL